MQLDPTLDAIAGKWKTPTKIVNIPTPAAVLPRETIPYRVKRLVRRGETGESGSSEFTSDLSVCVTRSPEGVTHRCVKLRLHRHGDLTISEQRRAQLSKTHAYLSRSTVSSRTLPSAMLHL
jgi:hypothetical protein